MSRWNFVKSIITYKLTEERERPLPMIGLTTEIMSIQLKVIVSFYPFMLNCEICEIEYGWTAMDEVTNITITF